MEPLWIACLGGFEGDVRIGYRDRPPMPYTVN